MTKSFLFLIGLALVLGVGLGGAFIGGVAFGKSQGDSTANVQGVAAFGAGGSQSSGFAGRNQSGGGLQQGSSATGVTPQSGNGTNSGSSFQRGGQGSSNGAFGRGGLMGTVESIDGNTLTITTTQGPVKATLSEGTTITKYVEATAGDLKVGDQVRVLGDETGSDGVDATAVTIIPQDSVGFQGRGFSGGRGSQQDQTGQ